MHASYDELMRDPQVDHMVEFLSKHMACGYNQVIAINTWRALMECWSAQERAFKLAIMDVCIGFSTMVDIRHDSLKTTEQSSQSRCDKLHETPQSIITLN